MQADVVAVRRRVYAAVQALSSHEASAPVRAGADRVLVVSDTGCRPGWQHDFRRLVRNLRTDSRVAFERIGAVIFNGDVVFTATDRDYRRARRVIEEEFSDVHRIFNIGNHELGIPWPGRQAETERKRIDRFRRYFHQDLNWSRQIGGVQYIGIDSSRKMMTRGSLDYLRAALANAALSVVATHVPPLLKRQWLGRTLYADYTRRFLDVLDMFPGRVLTCVYGHIHANDRVLRRGVQHILAGTGGAQSRFRSHSHYGPASGEYAAVLIDPGAAGDGRVQLITSHS